MSDHIRGSYPGGPSRSDASDDERPAHRVRSLSEFYDRQDRGTRRSRDRRRRRQLVWTFLVAALIAGVGGWTLGRSSNADAATIANELETSAQGSDLVSSEVDRVLLELWRMEELERSR